MEKLFERILDDDEKIEKVFKPQKTKLFLSSFFGITMTTIWFVIMGIIGVLVPEEGYEPEPIYVLIPIGCFVVILLFTWLFTAIYYKNLYYAYTNKRVIIRSGIFGVDYKSLDMGMIGAVNVYVSLLDKLLRKDTGSVTFGSMASPMVTEKGGSAYKFGHIVMPYETCKEVKAAIDKFKNTKK